MRHQIWKGCGKMVQSVYPGNQRLGVGAPAVMHWQRTLTARARPSVPEKQPTTETASMEVPEFEIVVPAPVKRGSFLKKVEIKETVSIEQHSQAESGAGFETMGLQPMLVEELKAMGVFSPTAIQAVAIPALLKGEDCALQSYTGSGKTLAYLLPILTVAAERTRQEFENPAIPKKEKGQLQALIVAPSQELAMQIVRVAHSILMAEDKQAVQQLIGGANIRRQIQALKAKPIVVVGTPGRLAELSRKGILLSHKCPIVVLDEVDQLRKQQFRADMLRIMEHVGKKVERRQTIIVSATLTKSAIENIGAWAPSARFVFMGSPSALTATQKATPIEQTTTVPRWGWGNKWNDRAYQSTEPVIEHGAVSIPPNIRHGYVLVEENRKIDALRRAIYAMDSKKSLVFMNFSKRTQDTLHKLSSKGMEVGSLHGDKNKIERASTLQKFRKGMLRAMVVSDVAARGLDVVDCDAVFNLELPSDAIQYAHRAGRTGRMGRDGWVLSFVEKHEAFVIDKMSKRLKITIPQVDIRNGEVRLREKEGMPKKRTNV